MSKNTLIKILLVDDHALVREGIAACLQDELGIEVIGYAANGVEAIEQCKQHQPDVVLMDVAMPVMDGLEATAILKKKWPMIKVLVLSLHNEPEYIQHVMQAGASGYVLKDVSFDDLLNGVKAVAQGNSYFSAGTTEHLFKTPSTITNTTPLTPRELEILCSIADGETNKGMANKYDIVVKTVETHRHNIKRKLKIYTTAGLTRYALKNRVCQ
jgi:two-component system nitrate/nitrite response regulator NarL